MPRKKIKTEHQPLRFRERPAGGARVQYNPPEVRAALNPKDFFRETQEHNGSTLNSWFDTSLAALTTKKRKRCQASASIQGNFTQLSRKGSVCSSKFPALLFETKSRELHRQKDDWTSSSSNDSSHQGFCHNTNTMCKRGMNKNDIHQNYVIKAHTGRVKSMCHIQSCIASETSCISPEDPSSHASKDCTNADTAPALLNAITPEIRNSTHSHAVNLLCSPPFCSPSRSRILDVLAPDTPERDYGVKVTWRRRRRLMLFLKEKGHLSDSDSMIHI